ncbi:MAG: alpha/beta hydrolase [Candidatus Methylomirabilia bacterium]
MADQTYVITNRVRKRNTYGEDPEPRGGIHFLVAQGRYSKDPGKFRELSLDQFKNQLLAALRQKARNGKRARAAIYIHGYNNTFKDALAELQEIGTGLARRGGYDGLVIGFTWPSEGRTLAYLEDRDDARESVTGFVHLMHLIKAIRMPAEECFVDVSMLAHSMGSYLLREGLNYFWKHMGYPWGDIYFAQTLMFAADIAYDSLRNGGSGQAISSFSHRVTAYYSIHDDILGLSRGVKHFGARRLGRSGPAEYGELPENVVGVDCSRIATPENAKKFRAGRVHSSYRVIPAILKEFVATMSGQDRAAIPNRVEIPGSGRKGYILR